MGIVLTLAGLVPVRRAERADGGEEGGEKKSRTGRPVQEDIEREREREREIGKKDKKGEGQREKREIERKREG